MIIILEGPDGGGKTTLAQQLSVRGFNVVKTNAPKPREDVLNSYMTALLLAVMSGTNWVFDRHYLGECVYGPLLRGEDRLGVQGRALIEDAIAVHGVKLIICLPPWETLERGWRSKSDLLTNVYQLRTVATRYLKEAERLNAHIYDWTKGNHPQWLLDRL